MSDELDQRSDEPALDRFVKRTRVYLGVLIAIVTAGTALTSWLVASATSGVRGELHAVRHKAVQDSVRFERAMGVVELAVIALIEEPGSIERQHAVDELRRRRRVTP